jgi:hypothetical protein
MKDDKEPRLKLTIKHPAEYPRRLLIDALEQIDREPAPEEGVTHCWGMVQEEWFVSVRQRVGRVNVWVRPLEEE